MDRVNWRKEGEGLEGRKVVSLAGHDMVVLCGRIIMERRGLVRLFKVRLSNVFVRVAWWLSGKWLLSLHGGKKSARFGMRLL